MIYTIELRSYMPQVAKLFKNGRSQAVRLPARYRFPDNQVYIRQDPETGDVILSRKPGSWKDFFKLLDTIDISDDYMNERDNSPAQNRKDLL